MKIEELWELIILQEDDDSPIQLQVSTRREAQRIKATLSLYKYRILKANPDLKDALGEFRLVYSITDNPQPSLDIREEDEVILSISIEYVGKRISNLEVEATPLRRS